MAECGGGGRPAADQERMEWEARATDIRGRAPLFQNPVPLALRQLLSLSSALPWRPQDRGRRELTSQRKGFSPECCSECTLRDMLRLKDFPQVSQVNGMSLV